MSLEVTRALHEELELLEKAMYTELGDPSTARLKRPDEIARDQVVATLLEAHRTRSERLSRVYADGDGARREEIDVIMSEDDSLDQFYGRLAKVREYHAKFPAEPVAESSEEQLLATVLETAADEGFTGEEADGRYVDMHTLHEKFLNLRGIERVDYRTYLTQCGALPSHVPRDIAASHGYQKYCRALLDYLVGFLRRTQPLTPVSQLLSAAETEFGERWDKREVARWQQQQEGDAAGGNGGEPSAGSGGVSSTVELGAYATAAALEPLGLEALKLELTRRGLKAGGSLQQRAERLFLYGGKERAEIPKQHLAKRAPAAQAAPPAAAASGADTGSGAGAPLPAHYRATALLEEQVCRLCDLLGETLDATSAMVEKKQTRTFEEITRDMALQEEDDARMADADADDAEGEEGDGADEAPIYNPLNLPLGFDGKPIPYWLYKLHGLNLEFKCEICGNYSYWGPRPFERHFQEWRHAYGMKCLGIPNTRPFHGITLIEDALTLHAKLAAEEGMGTFNADLDEEFEDRQGNVMNRKVYTDLARQGLLE